MKTSQVGSVFPAARASAATGGLRRPGSAVSPLFVSGWRRSRAGEVFDESSAFQFTPYLAALRIIAWMIALMPKCVFERTGTRSRTALPDHPLSVLLSMAPNAEMTGFSFWETALLWAQGWGDHYAEIERDRRGNVIALWPLEWPRVEVKRRPENGGLYYQIWNPDGAHAFVAPENMIHVPQLSFDGIKGLGYGQVGRNALGLGLASENFGADFFGNGAVPSGVLTQAKGTPNKEQVEQLKADWKKSYGGERRGEIAVLTNGMEYKQLTVPQNDAQFAETRVFQVREVSRLTGVPAYLLGDYENTPYSNIEHQLRQFVMTCLLPWCRRICNEYDVKCLDRAGPYFIEFDVSEITRGDHKTQGELFERMFRIGAMSPNEIRAQMGWNPGPPALDEYYKPINFGPLGADVNTDESLAVEERSGASGTNAFPSGNAADTAAADGEVIMATYGAALESALGRVIAREHKALDRMRGKHPGDAEFGAAAAAWLADTEQEQIVVASVWAVLVGMYRRESGMHEGAAGERARQTALRFAGGHAERMLSAAARREKVETKAEVEALMAIIGGGVEA